MGRPRIVAILLAVAALGAFVFSALGAEAASSHCKSKAHKTLCKGKQKKPKKVLFAFGSYGGKDGFGSVGVLVSKLSSGEHAGQVAVQLSQSAYQVMVHCTDGKEEPIHVAATGFVKGKGFSGAEAEPDGSGYTISGSFTSLKTMKGTYTVTSNVFGSICSTGSQSFTATWSP
jgi:hypothetical protein